MDEDGSGVVSLVEFTACCKALKEHMGSAAPPLCANASGVLQVRLECAGMWRGEVHFV